MEVLAPIKATNLKEQCPSFKDGCPFAKVEDKQTLEAIEKCPEFKDGCPFKDSKSLSEVYEKLSHIPHAAGHESELSGQKLIEMFKKMHDTSECLEEKLGDCPVFHKDQGCPFKSVRDEEGKHLVEPVESVSHDKHVIDELKAVDATHLKEQCPAFKDGCPFAKVEDKLTLEAIEKCPEFKDGCPFKDSRSLSEVYEKLSHIPHAAGHESEFSGQKLIEMFKKMHDTSECLEEKLGDCPVFHKDQGCPFKSVRDEEGKHLVEPVDSVSHYGPARSSRKVMTTEVGNVNETCPAFVTSCPFAKVSQDSGAFQNAMRCPKFKDGCAFKNCKSISDVYVKLQEIPNMSEETGSHGEILETMKHIHKFCIELENEIGQCPVFHTESGCPFKTVCSDGKFLVEILESYSTSRVLKDAANDTKEAIEKELVASSGVVLSSELKEGTRKIHSTAQNPVFIKGLLKGNLTLDTYKMYLSQLYFIYRTMEEESEKYNTHPQLKYCNPRELYRLPKIIQDLEYFYGSEWEKKIEAISTTQHYVAHLRKISEETPLLLIAHQYTRYMGDLSGGQIIKRVTKKSLGLSDDCLKIYTFEQGTSEDLKAQYRKNLDALGLDQERADELVQEAILTFQLNIAMFNELGTLCGVTSTTKKSKPVKVAGAVNASQPGKEQCPFNVTRPAKEEFNVTQITEKQSQVTKTEVSTSSPVSHGTSTSNLIILLGIGIALFAMAYAYLLA